MGIVSYEKVMSYILMVKEMEMNSNHTPTKEQTIIANKIHQQIEIDHNLKNLIDVLLTMNNVSEMNILYSNYASGKTIVKREVVKEKNNIQTINQNNLNVSKISIPKNISLQPSTPVISRPKVFVKTKNKKAGYIDAFVLALITGFAGGIVTTTILMMCS